jgi:hypothetical protein
VKTETTDGAAPTVMFVFHQWRAQEFGMGREDVTNKNVLFSIIILYYYAEKKKKCNQGGNSSFWLLHQIHQIFVL